MDSPSQPVNNHHVHSHAPAESELYTLLSMHAFRFVVVCVWLTLWHCFVEPERKYSAPTHHTTEHVPEKKFKSEVLLSTLTSDASKENTPGVLTRV